MRSFRFAVKGAASLLLAIACVGTAGAQLPLPGQVEGVKPPPIGIPPLFGGELISAKGLVKLNFTKEQKADFDKINDEYKQKKKETQAKINELAVDPTNVLEAVEAQKKLRPDYLAKVEKLLTESQKQVFEEIRREVPGIGGTPFLTPPIFPGFGPGQFLPAMLQQRLKLTDDQKKKVDELQKELEAKVLGLLTDEQKKTLEDLKKQGPRPGGFPGFPGDPKLVPLPVLPRLIPGGPKAPVPPLPPKLVPPDLSTQVDTVPPKLDERRVDIKKTEK